MEGTTSAVGKPHEPAAWSAPELAADRHATTLGVRPAPAT